MRYTLVQVNERFCRALSHALFDSDLIATRITLTVAELLWSVMLLWPGDTFARPPYEVMGVIAREECWAVVFALSAVTQFTIVMQQDYYTRWAHYFSAWNALLWSTAVISILLSVYPPPAAIGGEIALALGASWIWARPLLLSQGYRRAAAADRQEEPSDR